MASFLLKNAHFFYSWPCNLKFESVPLALHPWNFVRREHWYRNNYPWKKFFSMTQCLSSCSAVNDRLIDCFMCGKVVPYIIFSTITIIAFSYVCQWLISSDRLDASVCDGRRVGVCAAWAVRASSWRPFHDAALQRQHRLQDAHTSRTSVLQNHATRDEGVYSTVPRYLNNITWVCIWLL